MKKQWIKRLLSMLIVLILIVPVVQADETTYQKEINQAISEIERIRKQLIAMGESGYMNHVEKKSNQEQINLVQVYMSQVPAIRKNLQEIKEQDLDKFQQRNVNTLLSVMLYLEDMGATLRDYLLATDLKEQFKELSIFIQTNEFIVDIVGTVKDSI